MLPLLTLIVFLPLLGAIVIALLPQNRPEWPRWVALAFSGPVLVLAIGALIEAAATGVGDASLMFTERYDWIPEVGIQYFLGVDGLSLPLLGLSALLSFLAVLASWKVTHRTRFYFAMLMLLAVGMNGVFAALDFVLFYVFWELVLVPMYFLIAIWGGSRREYAAIKFFLYTLFGSVFMLVGILALYLSPVGGTFDMIALADRGFPLTFQLWVFAAFFVGFAVKVPVWPFHTWLPDAHVEAPTAASMLLAGVLLKMGTYGFLRVSLPVLPEAWEQWRWFIALLAVVSIVYGAAVAFAQADLKKLVAYSSISHMGFAMLGIAAGTAAGLNGAMAVNISHGFLSALLFFLVGAIYERAHTRQISEISGVASQLPVLGGFIAFASFASLGLPGLSGFVGEFLSLLGAWQSDLARAFTIVAAAGVLLGATYMLWMVQRVVLGQPSYSIADAEPMRSREVLVALPLALLSLVMGLWWGSLLQYTDPVATSLSRLLGV